MVVFVVAVLQLELIFSSSFAFVKEPCCVFSFIAAKNINKEKKIRNDLDREHKRS